LNQLTDETLLGHYANGDFSAFETLYLRNKGGVYRYLSRQVHNKSQVEDLFQEVWAKVISHGQHYQQTASFKTWLYTIARNKVIDHVRHMQVVDHVIDSSIEEDEQQPQHTQSKHALGQALGPANLHQRLLQAQAIDYCLHKLPIHQLDCFLLREEAGFTAAAIAEIVNINLEAAKSRLKAGYKNLRSCLSLKLELSPGSISAVMEGKANE
jgi:RNA polymerase sigma-70 factor (ECF subfamily)